MAESLFSPEFMARNADTLQSVNSGPTTAQVRSAGASSGLAPSVTAARRPDQSAPFFAPDSSPGEFGFDDVGRIGLNALKAVAAPFTVPAHMGMQKDAARQELLRAQSRQLNLASAAQGIQLMSSLAQNVATVQDPEKRRAIIASASQSVAQDFGPGLVPLFESMAEHTATAYIERQEQLAKFMQYSPTLSAYAVANNGDFGDVPAEVLTKGISEVNHGVAREHLPKAKSLAGKINREYEQQFLSESKDQEKSDKAITVSEFEERVAAMSDQFPELQDPATRSRLFASAKEFPQAFGLKEDEAAKKRRELIEKEAIKASFRDPSTPANAEVRNVRLPSGETIIGRVTPDGIMVPDATGRLVPAPRGSQLFGTQVTGTADEAFPGSDKALPEALDASARLSRATDLLRDLEKVGPGGVGVRGLVGSKLGGYLGQVNETLGDMTAQGISGTSLQEMQEFEANARAIVAQSVKTLEIEESGRITDMERILAEKATGLTSPGKSFAQVRAGIVALQQLAIVTQDRKIIEGGGAPMPLETDEQQLAELQRYLDMGMNEAQASETLRSVQTMRQEIGRVIDSLRQGGARGR